MYSSKIGNETAANIIPIEGEPNKYLVTLGDRIAILTWYSSRGKATVRYIRRPDPTRPYPEFSINDGKVAPNGAVFFFYIPNINSADIAAAPPDQCTLYDIYNKKQKALVNDLKFGDGLGFSEDGRYFYYSDSAHNLTYKAYYDERNNLLISKSVKISILSISLCQFTNIIKDKIQSSNYCLRQ